MDPGLIFACQKWTGLTKSRPGLSMAGIKRLRLRLFLVDNPEPILGDNPEESEQTLF